MTMPGETVSEMFQPEGAPVRSATLAKLMKRATTDHAGQGGKIRRRRIKFTIDHTICEPGMFDADFDLVLTCPSSHDELAALKRSENDPGAMIFELIRCCIVSVDGEQLHDGDLTRDAVWEALGLTGRQLVASKWKEINEPSAAARKKADASTVLL
jgi:hypothetical protein